MAIQTLGSQYEPRSRDLSCGVQVLCGLGLAWGASAGQQWIGFLIAALGALQIAVQGWSRRRNSHW